MRLTLGYLMMELLAAIALASFGLFGFVKVQHLSVATEYDLIMHIEGNMLLSEMEDFINNTALCPDLSAVPENASGAVDCANQSCSEWEFTAFQFALWQCRVGMRSEDAAVCDDGKYRLPRKAKLSVSSAGDQFTLELEWSGSGGQVKISRTMRSRCGS